MTNLKLYTPGGPIVAWRDGGRSAWSVRLPGGEVRAIPAGRRGEPGLRAILGDLSRVAADRFGGVESVEAFEELPAGRTRGLAAFIG